MLYFFDCLMLLCFGVVLVLWLNWVWDGWWDDDGMVCVFVIIELKLNNVSYGFFCFMVYEIL